MEVDSLFCVQSITGFAVLFSHFLLDLFVEITVLTHYLTKPLFCCMCIEVGQSFDAE